MDDKGGKQAKITFLAFAGIGTVAFAVVVFFISAVLLVGIGKVVAIILVPVGILMVVAALLMGWGEAFGDPSKKPVQRAAGVYVIAKVIADKKSNPVIDAEFYDPSELQYLVQFDVPGRGKVEMQTSPEVFNQVGEGMSGDIVYQGRWLNQFVFRPRAGAAQIGEDPFRAGKL